MRILMFCVCLGVASTGFTAEDMSDCAAIDSAVERLDCYDRLARRTMEEQADVTDGEADEGAASPERPSANAAMPPSTGATPAEDRRPATNRGTELFGKRPELSPEEDIDQIEARIDSVSRTPRGQYVMTLSNGQVWMETEPGRRPIRAHQSVVIRKRFFHYEMELKSRPNVTVRRVE